MGLCAVRGAHSERHHQHRAAVIAGDAIPTADFPEEQKEFEKSIVVLPNADVIRTDNSVDLFFGNALDENNLILGWGSNMNKITTLIAYDDEEIKNRIYNILNEKMFK